MQLAVPTHKTMSEQLGPMILAVAMVSIGAIFIPVSYPLDVSDGSAKPAVARPGETIDVDWRQEWRDRCPLTVTRGFIGADGFKLTAAPIEVQPPKELGVLYRTSPLTVPTLPPGTAYYHADIEPHCWIDKVWQRKYRSPEIVLTILPPVPAGPR